MAVGNEFSLKQADTWPFIRVQLRTYDPEYKTANPTSDGMVPVPLPAGTTIKFRMSKAGTDDLLVFEDADIVFPSDQEPWTHVDHDVDKCGVVEYAWAIDGSETEEPGENKAEWVVTFVGGRKATFPRGHERDNATLNYNQVFIETRVT